MQTGLHYNYHMTQTKMIDRVRKLLSLATSSNEHEAAAAAAQAADLMVQFEIEEAMLDIEGESVEVPEDALIDNSSRNRVPWKTTVAAGIARSVGGRVYTQGGSVRVVAQPSKMATISYLYAYLVEEVNSLANKAYKEECEECDASGVGRPSARSWKNAFRLGASNVIRTRLDAQRAKTKENAKRLQPSDTTTTALATIAKGEEAVTKYVRQNLKLGRAPRASYSSGSGYGAGKAAGKTMGLGGGARGALR